MSPISKFKSNDEILSMYLVPKKMFNTLLKILDEDEENKNELIALNQSQTNNNNYIENAIAFKKKQMEQKKNTSTSNLQKNNIVDTQSAVSPNTLSRTVSTFRPLQQGSDTLPSDVSSEITLPESQTSFQQEKSSKKRKLTYSTSTPVEEGDSIYTNSPIIQAINTKNKAGKRVCPICTLQYPDVKNLAKHLLSKHPSGLHIKVRRTLQELSNKKSKITPSPSKTQSTPFSTPSAEETNVLKNTGAKKKLFKSNYPKL